jgi:hypothetical protein
MPSSIRLPLMNRASGSGCHSKAHAFGSLALRPGRSQRTHDLYSLLYVVSNPAAVEITKSNMPRIGNLGQIRFGQKSITVSQRRSRMLREFHGRNAQSS